MDDPSDAALSVHVIDLLRAAGFRVSLFRNPGSLYGTVGPFVEAQATRDDQAYVATVFTTDHPSPELACVSELALLCGVDLEC